MKTLTRLERLDRLESWLKSDTVLVLREAARDLGVSLRTITRDIELLRDRGLPIEADRGRGGGVRLPSHWNVGRIALTRSEAVDLLIGLTLAEQTDLAMQMAQSGAIRRKLMASFSHADQQRISALRHRIRAGAASSLAVRDSFAPSRLQIGRDLKEAFLLMRLINMTYRDAQGARSTRRVEPHYLVLNSPVWYLMCWDHARNAVRSFRCDRVERVEIGTERFALRAWDDFTGPLSGNLTAPI